MRVNERESCGCTQLPLHGTALPGQAEEWRATTRDVQWATCLASLFLCTFHQCSHLVCNVLL